MDLEQLLAGISAQPGMFDMLQGAAREDLRRAQGVTGDAARAATDVSNYLFADRPDSWTNVDLTPEEYGALPLLNKLTLSAQTPFVKATRAVERPVTDLSSILGDVASAVTSNQKRVAQERLTPSQAQEPTMRGGAQETGQASDATKRIGAVSDFLDENGIYSVGPNDVVLPKSGGKGVSRPRLNYTPEDIRAIQKSQSDEAVSTGQARKDDRESQLMALKYAGDLMAGGAQFGQGFDPIEFRRVLSTVQGSLGKTSQELDEMVAAAEAARNLGEEQKAAGADPTWVDYGTNAMMGLVAAYFMGPAVGKAGAKFIKPGVDALTKAFPFLKGVSGVFGDGAKEAAKKLTKEQIKKQLEGIALGGKSPF